MEKRWFVVFNIIFSIIFISIVSVALSGCASRPRVDTSVLEHQRQIDELESRVRSYEATTEYAIRELETLSRRAEEMGGTVDELIELFDEYQQTVERILYHYRATESKTENSFNSSYSFNDNTRT